MDKKEQCLKMMRRLYGTIPGYDAEEDYGIMRCNLEHENQLRGVARGMTWADVFKGLNRVSLNSPPVRTLR
jgi:hypothetical protein